MKCCVKLIVQATINISYKDYLLPQNLTILDQGAILTNVGYERLVTFTGFVRFYRDIT